MGEKKKSARLKGDEVLEVLRRLHAGGIGSTSTAAIWDEIATNWPGPDSASIPGQQAVYLHLVRLQKAGKVTSRRVGLEGGGQHAVWEPMS